MSRVASCEIEAKKGLKSLRCLKTESELVSEEEQCEETNQKVELGKLNTSIPTTSSEVETRVQQLKVENKEEVVIEEHPDEEYPLADYNLARDRERRQSRASRRYGYESDLAFSLASYEELAYMSQKPLRRR